jgi:hypothetical protein
MKPLNPILIAVGIAVAIILIMTVSIPYQEEQQQKKFAQEGLDELNKCMQYQQQIELNPFIDQTQNQMMVKQYSDCVDNAIEKYGTDEVKQKIKEANMPSYQPNEYEFEKPSVKELEERKAEIVQNCIDSLYGQVDAMNRCINTADMVAQYQLENP